MNPNTSITAQDLNRTLLIAHRFMGWALVDGAASYPADDPVTYTRRSPLQGGCVLKGIPLIHKTGIRHDYYPWMPYTDPLAERELLNKAIKEYLTPQLEISYNIPTQPYYTYSIRRYSASAYTMGRALADCVYKYITHDAYGNPVGYFDIPTEV